MMSTTVPAFPIFTLSVQSPFVIAGGGGGDIKYGKQNGIVIYDLTTYKGYAHYETNNVVDNLTTWRHENKDIMIAACTVKDLYVLKYSNKIISLVFAFPQRVTKVYFNIVMFVISNENLIMGPCDNFPIPQQIPSRSCNEEFVYSLECNNNKYYMNVPIENIPKTWHSIFFVGNKIHKLVYDNNKYSFVFNNRRYTYDFEVLSITYIIQKDMVVFFIKNEDLVYMISKKEIIKVSVPKITCLTINNGEIYVGTGEGKIFSVGNTVEKVHEYRLPITGLAYRANYVYFSSIDGCIDRRNISNRRYFFFAVIIVIIIALVIGKYLQ